MITPGDSPMGCHKFIEGMLPQPKPVLERNVVKHCSALDDQLETSSTPSLES